MAGSSEGAKKGAATRLAKLRETGGEKAVSAHYAKLASAGKGKKVKKGLAVLKETNPEKFREITSMGGKNRWNKKKALAKESPAVRKARITRQKNIDRAQEKDEFYDRTPKGVKKATKFEEEGDTGW